jgi:hypothetical protein
LTGSLPTLIEGIHPDAATLPAADSRLRPAGCVDLGKGQEFRDVATKGHAEQAVLTLLSAGPAKRRRGVKPSSAGS